MSTPELHLQTCFVLDADARIASTREPNGSRGPLFSLVRGLSSCAWAIRDDVPAEVAEELDRLARDEPQAVDFRAPPIHAQRYLDALAGRARAARGISEGVAFSFPDEIAESDEVAVVASEALLERNFRGWIPGEIAAGRGPVLAIFDRGFPVSVCFCARRSDFAAEAGLETAEPYRRRGLGARVAAAWAVAIRSAGRVPLYSTSWTNEASLGVARRLRLLPYASSWSVTD
jgi:hypothetical protein